MIDIPPFEEALSTLTDLLATSGKPTSLVFARRRDYYSTALQTHLLVWPLPDQMGLAREAFENGRQKGLVRLEALFGIEAHSVVGIHAPAADAVLGWSEGLKLSVREPFVAAKPISPGAWAEHRDLTAYARFQELAEPGELT